MTVIKREQCPDCAAVGKDTKGDNLVYYENGSVYCHGCEKVVNSENVEDEDRDDIEIKVGSEMEHGEYKELLSRGISEATCRKYGYMQAPKKHIANWLDDAGNVVLQKIRLPGKEFYFSGNTEYTDELWGKWIRPPRETEFVTITEGEIDCLSVAEVFNCRFAVVSLPQGGKAKSAARVISKNLEWLNKFKYVVLALDNDKTGREAVEACLPLFEPGKVRVAKWPDKDASDLLQKGQKRKIQDVIYSATEYMPPAVKFGDALDDCLHRHKKETIPWPWPAVNKLCGEMEKGRVYVVASRPGVGKTMIGHSLAYHSVKNSKRVGYIPLEENMSDLILQTHDRINGTKFHELKNDWLTDEQIKQTKHTRDHLVLYDQDVHGASIEAMERNIPYMARTAGCDIIVYDNLSFSSGVDSAGWKELDQAIIMFKRLALKYNFVFIVVCHLNRKNSDFEDGNPKPHEHDLRGSQGIESFTDCVIGLWRDTKHEDSSTRNTLYLYNLKDRITGQGKGKHCALSYNVDLGILEDFNSGLDKKANM